MHVLSNTGILFISSFLAESFCWVYSWHAMFMKNDPTGIKQKFKSIKTIKIMSEWREFKGHIIH